MAVQTDPFSSYLKFTINNNNNNNYNNSRRFVISNALRYHPCDAFYFPKKDSHIHVEEEGVPFNLIGFCTHCFLFSQKMTAKDAIFIKVKKSTFFKLYKKMKKELESLVNTARMFSDDIR